jgi:two-component system sensor histidine kinase YesM
MLSLRFFVVVFFSLTIGAGRAFAQDSPKQQKGRMESNSTLLKEALDNNDDRKAALAYEGLAKEYISKKDYEKAEKYYLKAKEAFSKLNKSDEDVARVTRGLAKAQEAQHKEGEAIQNFEQSSNSSNYSNTRKLNTNDAQRLRNNANPDFQEQSLKDNITILEQEGKQSEVAESYKQLGDIQVQQNNLPEALQNYKAAIAQTSDPQEMVELNKQIADVYTSGGEIDKAIEVQKQLLSAPELNKDVPSKIKQIQNLAAFYNQHNDTEQALTLLKESYELALKENRTVDAKNSLEALVKIYNQIGTPQKSIEIYQSFLNRLENLLLADSSLVDVKLLQATEEKIQQLENEKGLKDQLIEKKNKFNYFLIFSSLLLLLFVGLVGRALYAIKIKNKKIALQSLRREMNPHFIFNSLNSINQFISQNNELAANKYLTSYSTLMRQMMENSNKDFISLSNELELIKKYLALEHQRFTDKFDYTIEVAEDIDTDTVEVANMIIQPHLENAVWHGLRYRESKGKLEVRFFIKNGILTVIIEDNGIGLTKSKALKTNNQKSHVSRGLNNTNERIALLNKLYHKNIKCTVEEREKPEEGTRVKCEM